MILLQFGIMIWFTGFLLAGVGTFDLGWALSLSAFSPVRKTALTPSNSA